jgi:hypothetical protein
MHLRPNTVGSGKGIVTFAAGVAGGAYAHQARSGHRQPPDLGGFRRLNGRLRRDGGAWGWGFRPVTNSR